MRKTASKGKTTAFGPCPSLIAALLWGLWVPAAAGPGPAAGGGWDGSVPAYAVDSYAQDRQALQLLAVEQLFFAHDRAQLDAASIRALDRTVAYLRSDPHVERVIIHGHTDEVAGDPYNENLSDRRAQAVVKYLVQQGIPPSLLSSEGLGEYQPVDENWTRHGRARNRRVEIYLVRRLPRE